VREAENNIQIKKENHQNSIYICEKGGNNLIEGRRKS
jgi:hypothetical protein